MQPKTSQGRRSRATGKRDQVDEIASPFAVLVDTREQKPYDFQGLKADAKDKRRPLVVPVMRGTINAGDYSIAGWPDKVAIERKSKDDFFGTVGQWRERFRRELERLATLPIAFVVIEAVWMEIVLHPPAYSEMRYKNLFRSVVAWQYDFPTVHWWFCPTRRFAEQATYRILARAYELKERKNERPSE